jgi:hypothetical protein
MEIIKIEEHFYEPRKDLGVHPAFARVFTYFGWLVVLGSLLGYALFLRGQRMTENMISKDWLSSEGWSCQQLIVQNRADIALTDGFAGYPMGITGAGVTLRQYLHQTPPGNPQTPPFFGIPEVAATNESFNIVNTWGWQKWTSAWSGKLVQDSPEVVVIPTAPTIHFMDNVLFYNVLFPSYDQCLEHATMSTCPILYGSTNAPTILPVTGELEPENSKYCSSFPQHKLCSSRGGIDFPDGQIWRYSEGDVKFCLEDMTSDPAEGCADVWQRRVCKSGYFRAVFAPKICHAFKNNPPFYCEREVYKYGNDAILSMTVGIAETGAAVLFAFLAFWLKRYVPFFQRATTAIEVASGIRKVQPEAQECFTDERKHY